MSGKPGLRSLYLYAVCLITLVMVLVGGVNTVRSVVAIAYPGVEYYDPYYPAGPEGEAPSEEERDRALEQQEEAERRRSVLDLAGALSLLLIAAPAYAYHWRRVQKENDGASRAVRVEGEPGRRVTEEP